VTCGSVRDDNENVTRHADVSRGVYVDVVTLRVLVTTSVKWIARVLLSWVRGRRDVATRAHDYTDYTDYYSDSDRSTSQTAGDGVRVRAADVPDIAAPDSITDQHRSEERAEQRWRDGTVAEED